MDQEKPLPYLAKVVGEIDNGHGVWKSYKIGVFKLKEGPCSSVDAIYEEQIGEYVCHYSLMKTFFPFAFNDKEYALFSAPDYTAARVMELPSCKDIGGEEASAYGFCPVEFFVIPGTSHGFVAGCAWWDDTSWKIQYLDLSEVDKGIIKRSEKFGYVEMPDDMSLSDCITYEADEDAVYFKLACSKSFDIKTGKEL
jgi:hypothetical protein